MMGLHPFVQEYLHSFSEAWSKKGFFIALADALWYASVFIVLFLAGSIAGFLKEGFGVSLSQDQIVGLVWKSMILLAAIFLLLLLCWAASRTVIWSLLLGHSVTKKLVAKFALLYIVWLALWALPFYFSWKYVYDLVQMNLQPGFSFFVLQYIVLALFLYFTYAVSYRLTSSTKVFSSIGEGVMLSLREAPLLLGPFLMMVATIVVVGFLSKLAEFFPSIFSAIVGSILFFATFTWAKVYYTTVLKRAAHPQKHQSSSHYTLSHHI